MAFWFLISNVPLGVVLLVGCALSIRNYFRLGRPARIALVGYFLLLAWYWTLLPILIAFNFPPTPGSNFDHFLNRLFSVNAVLQIVFPPLGLAELIRAVFSGRSDPRPPVEAADTGGPP